MARKILIIAGEASGDLYGAHLVLRLKKKWPDAKFSGVGGAKMKEAGVNIIRALDEISIIGVSEIFLKLKVIKNLFSLLRAKIDEERFDLGILVNYPGFNLRLAKILKEKKIPVVFYSSPQVWAWGKWRLEAIKRYVDKMIVFFKFEEAFYKRNGIGAELVGHPLVDIVKAEGYDLGIKKGGRAKTISLVPGSRESEVKNLFPIMLEAAKEIYSKNKDLRFLVTKHPQLPPQMYLRAMEGYKLPLSLIDGKIYDCLKESDLAIAASGSVTLEAAILKTPMVIIYRLSFLTGILFLIFARLANIGLVNIVAGKRIMPELVQYHCTPEKIAKEVIDILSDARRYKKMKEDLELIDTLIGPSGASDRAAASIAKLLP